VRLIQPVSYQLERIVIFAVKVLAAKEEFEFVHILAAQN